MKEYVKDVDLWVFFATKIANVESFKLKFNCYSESSYEFPQFAYKNTLLKNLVFWYCQLKPCGNVNWTSQVSLKIGRVELTDGAMEKVLSGCPNLDCLKLDVFSGIHRLEISSAKLRKLIIKDYYHWCDDLWLEILAPFIQTLQLLGHCSDVCLPHGNVPSLVTTVLHLGFGFDFDEEDDDEGDQNLEKQYSNMKQCLHSVAHVENLELSPWFIECLSILELKGWQFPPSSRKFLELSVAFKQLDFPGICSFLQSSLDLETLVIEWYDNRPRDLLSRYTNEDEQTRRFETHNFNCSFPYLKTIKIINFYGSVLPLVKYLLKHATVLEQFVIVAAFNESDVSSDYESDGSLDYERYVSPDYVEMALELLSFPRSSPHASVIFSY
ncbi:F-box/LRR-repeat protein At3g03360-like [Lycium ferocissimum]|uniref:F-box/LRR-repeat protein At3g03360-like n=1 Tax=Lycium ferocissimum TaxID=112874 RepID=UPI002814D0D0|nr:F-box/LRR-repeat protein At3g03360-like [Lycium ferocissimum]